ncbi:uncharacterized protein LOC6640142 [Drosophila willistoni]|uniref:uncharacterized protein LOC6640142 n=1 Tax=Drosophila willistoni TaxID=7260 RepID=UPI000C26D744|nr:uncharacterized protein LOC6640142 [Drosophila willistoni]
MVCIRQTVLLLIGIFLVFVQGKKYHYYPRPLNIEGPTTTSSPLELDQVRYSPELIRDFRDFINLIPQVTIDTVVAKHMFIDSDFRKAVLFLRSSSFKQFQRRAEQTPEVINIMNYLHLNDTTLPRRVRRSYDNDIVILVLMPSEPQRNLHTFISFVEELLTHLPRQEYVNLIKDKCEKSAIFAKFYQALRSSEFIPMIEQAMVTQNVKNLISTLNSNFIDAHSLKNIAFEVISWGPVI